MIANLKSLNGVKQLTKPEQKNVQGGQACAFQYYNKLTGETVGGGLGTTFPPGQAGSNAAREFCVDHVITTGEGCRYNCEWDDVPSLTPGGSLS